MILPTCYRVTDTLAIIAVGNPIAADSPHLLIERQGGGLVRVEAAEARRLACKLLEAHRELVVETEQAK